MGRLGREASGATAEDDGGWPKEDRRRPEETVGKDQGREEVGQPQEEGTP